MSDLEERRALIVATAASLHVNGQQTEETHRAVERLAANLGLTATLVARWGDLLIGTGREGNERVSIVPAVPAVVAMNRVAEISRIAEAVSHDRLAVSAARERLSGAAELPLSSDHLFALACAVGAVALSITFGLAHLASGILIFVSAGAGGYLRRYAGRSGANNFVQVFLGGLLAGAIGSIGVRAGISSDLRLIAVCPCMVMVPGPYLLNGTLDLFAYRIPLGASRLAFALLTLLAIAAGVLIALAIGGTGLPPGPTGRDVPILLVVLAAGIAASCYGVFYSMPPAMLGWPVLGGMVADATRWAAMNVVGVGAGTGALIAGLVAGIILVPVAHRRHLPFAGIGFAAVVSLMPGVLVFRMVGGLLAMTASGPADAALLDAITQDGFNAAVIVLGITVGIVVPKHVYDAVTRRIDHRGVA